MTNALNQVTTFNSYDSSGRPTLVTDANGLQTAFTYDERGNVLTTVLTPTSGTARTTTFTYTDANQLETISTPDGTVLTYAYTAAHYLDSVTDNFGNKIEYDYDAMGNLKDEDTYDPGSVLKRAVDYAYDLNNRLDTITDGGFLTDLTVDLVGNLTHTTDPKLATTQNTYDALNRLDTSIDALAGVIDYGYDDHDNLTSVNAANGAQTTFTYDDLDDLTQEISPDRGTTTYTHDEAGNVKTMTDARGKVTTYAYDALNRLTLTTFDDLSTIAYEYDTGSNALGRLNKITDSTGNTAWSYNNFGEVTQKVQTIGVVALTTGYGYDSVGRMSMLTLPSGKVVTYGHNTYQPTTVSVDGTTILSGASYDPFGPVNAWTWGNGSFASRVFDQRGLATSILFAGDNQAIGYDAAGQVTSQQDTAFNVSYDYDQLGRITDFSNLNGGGSGSPPGPMFTSAPVILASVQTTNNETGTPPSGNPTPWLMTVVRNVNASTVQLALGRAEVNTGTVGSAESIGYIAFEGGASGAFSANGGTVNYEAQTSTDSVQGWGNGCYASNFVSAFASAPTVVATINRHDGGDGGWARRCSLNNTAIGLTIDEDQYRDTERNHTHEAVGFAAFSQDFDVIFTDGVGSWGMEAASTVLAATTSDPTFRSITFRQAYSTPPVVVVLATNETSDPASIRIRNVTTTGFEAAQVEPANADGTQGAMTMHYLAVEAGTHELPDGTRVLASTVSTSRQQHGAGVSGAESWETVTYADWPGSSGGPLPNSQAFDYDANGNRSLFTEDSTPYSYTNLANSNRLLSTAGPAAKTYTYDAAGNVIADGLHSYGYDDRGRLVSVDTTAATYAHNGQGQRVKKDNGTVSLFAYDEGGNLIGEYDSLGNAVQEHVWFNGAPVAVLQGTNTHYVHTDHLGTPRTIADGNTVIWRWASDPFGATAAEEDPDGDTNPFTYNLRFPGQYYDVETGLHYNYYRTYDPSTGRYLESDPIGLAAGPNTYVYVENMPTMQVDPFGLFGTAGHAQARLEQARRDGRVSNNPAPISGSIGAGGAWHGGPAGIALESGLAFGDDGSVCLYSRRCGTFGMGAFATLGGSAAGATGQLCSGSYKTFGVAGGGGVFGGGGGSTEYSPDASGVSGARGFGGIAVGGFGGIIECSYTLICFNESESCNDCGSE